MARASRVSRCSACAFAVSIVRMRSPSATVTILHINDVYEIDAIEGGRTAVSAARRQCCSGSSAREAPVLMTLGGDYLSPSAIGTAIIDGEPLAGRQMVDVLNHVGLDWAVLGNHEFDVSEAAFRARLAESRFRVVSSNVSDVNGQPFPGTVRSAIVPVQAGGRTIRLGIIGLTIDSTGVRGCGTRRRSTPPASRSRSCRARSMR